MKGHLPEVGTVLIRAGMRYRNPAEQRLQDRLDYPGYFVHRVPLVENRCYGPKFLRTIDFNPDADERANRFTTGLDDWHRFDPDAYAKYEDELGQLRAEYGELAATNLRYRPRDRVPSASPIARSRAACRDAVSRPDAASAGPLGVVRSFGVGLRSSPTNEALAGK